MTVSRRALLPGAAALAAAATAACSPLRVFNTLAPSDGGVRTVGRGLAFGPGPRQAMDVYAPSGPGPRPMLVFFYGGSWNSGRRQEYAWAGRALAAQGFVVAIPDYRLVPEVRFPGFVQDGAAAVARLQAEAVRLGGDPDRIVLCGHSAGAYIAVLLALDPRHLRRRARARSAARPG
jgi:acetyl esterase/lipase